MKNMPRSEIAHLELLAEVDSLVDRLNRWADGAPAWPPADKCRALVRRLTERAASLRVRLDAPLIVATLGGTGTGKSAMVNAIVGAEVVRTGRSRPTTMRPTLVCRPDLTPEMLGIDPAGVELVHRDLPSLRDLVLVDCPDPDTTEEGDAASAEKMASVSPSNLARLRAILPKCDVLLVAATQQKYRSARVADELAAAAPGAHLVFVQTHADLEDDIREDWRQVLASEQKLPSSAGHHEVVGAGGEGCRQSPSSTPTLSQRERGREHHIFRIDSLAALADAQAGVQPRGEFADLLDLLTRQMAGAAGSRIRRANFLDLTAETLDSCLARVEEAMPRVREVEAAIDEQRGLLARQITAEMQADLLANRRQWENRLLGKAASRWGFSPFSLVLRVYQGIGGLLSIALLRRARTPAQMALWGALEGIRTWRKHHETRQADRGLDQVAADGWDASELRKAAIIVEGYVAEAGLDRSAAQWNTVAAEAETAAGGFVVRVSAELESLIARLAERHTGWCTRLYYELLLAIMLGLLIFRLGKNFFYDSWLAEHPLPVCGLDAYLVTGFWLVLWCLLLLWMFCRRLRGGLRGEINQLAAGWQNASVAADILAHVEAECRRTERFRQELVAIRQDVDGLRRQVAVGGQPR